MRVFKNIRFSRFSRKENISDATLLEAIKSAEQGQIDSDLGGGVIKQRIARAGQGKRGGYRVLILYRTAHRAFFVYGFAKSEQKNISTEEADALKLLAKSVLDLPDEMLDKLLQQNVFTEVL